MCYCVVLCVCGCVFFYARGEVAYLAIVQLGWGLYEKCEWNNRDQSPVQQLPAKQLLSPHQNFLPTREQLQWVLKWVQTTNTRSIQYGTLSATSCHDIILIFWVFRSVRLQRCYHDNWNKPKGRQGSVYGVGDASAQRNQGVILDSYHLQVEI